MTELSIPYEKCNKQGKIFAMANRLGYNLEEYADRFLNSALISDSGDSDFSYYQLAAPSYSLDMIDDDEIHEETAKEGAMSNDEAFWIGFFYKYLAIAFSMSSAEIVKRIPFAEMRLMYDKFGSLSKDDAKNELWDLFRPQ